MSRVKVQTTYESNLAYEHTTSWAGVYADSIHNCGVYIFRAYKDGKLIYRSATVR